MNLTLNLMTAGVAATVALGVFFVFVVLRFLGEGLARLLFRREEGLIADRLTEHLEAVQAPTNLGARLDRVFERMVGRSSLQLNGRQAAAYLLLVGVAAGSAVYLWQGLEELALGAGLGGAALLLSFFWVLHWRWRRQVQEQLPDTFHLMARSLRAGLTVDQSVSLLAAQGQPPLSAEFRRCSEHLKLGLTVPAAFEMTGSRLDLPDFDLLVSLVGLHRQTGGNLPLLVDRLAATVRSRNHFRGHLVAVTALGRLSGFCLAIAPPLLMVLYWLIYPDFMKGMLASPQGVTALCVAGILEVVGVVWLWLLLRVDY